MALVTCYWMLDLAGLITALFATIYFYFKYQHQHWRRRGFPTASGTSFPAGDFPGISQTAPMDQLLAGIYRSSPNEPVVGCYIMHKPILIIRDMELVKNILVKDFAHFHDRGFYLDKKKDPLNAHLFFMEGQDWRNLRIKLTPTFTSGKMKMMFQTLMEVGIQLQEIFEEASNDEETEMKDILARYTTDVISSVAFGLDSNSLKNPNAEFRKVGIELANPSFKERFLGVIFFVSPTLAKLLPISTIPHHITNFFMKITREAMEYRQMNNVKRNDFLQLLLELKTLGYIKEADGPKQQPELDKKQKFTIEQAAAQAFLFFFAGFETSSATMNFAFYELALNPDLQKQVQQEIDAVQAKHNGEVSYEALMEMDLLDRIVAETLRKYPVGSVLMRTCGKEYKIPDSELTLLPGDSLWFSLYGYHHDPKYYPDPEKFDPDRFLPEVKETRPHHAYLPFGDGPRNCIGNRFGLMQTKAGLAVVLSRFTIAPSKRTPIPIEFDPHAQLHTSKGPMYLSITKRTK